MDINENLDWTFVSKLVVRKTGFPFEILEQLHWKETMQQLIVVASLEKDKELLTEQLLRDIIPRSVKLYAEQNQKSILHLLSRIRKYLAKNVIRNRELEEVNQFFPSDHPMRKGLQRWHDVDLLIHETIRGAKDKFLEELKMNRQQLQKIFQDPYLAEAVYISNPDVFNISYPRFMTHRDYESRPSKIRTLEMRFYSYLQRFCSKNDTASFFGPMNYAEWDMESHEPVHYEAHSGKFTERIVHYSFWMVRELAKGMTEEQEIQNFLIPRLHPMCTLQQNKLFFLHLNKEVLLPTKYEKIVQEISNEEQNLHQLSAKLGLSIPELTRYIKQLADRNIVLFEIEIPSTIFDPLSYLYSWLKDLPLNNGSKRKWLDILEQFIHLKKEALAKDLAHRQDVTDRMEQLFEEVTRSSARRSQGQMYADRTLYYEECKGTIDRLSFGQNFYDDFMERLKPVLDLSAAYGDVMRDYYQTIAQRIFEKIKDNRTHIPYSEFIYQSQALLDEAKVDLSFAALDQFHTLLDELVQIRQEGSIAHITSEDVEHFKRFRKFEECHTSPDVMFSAKDLDALSKGDYKIILGEVHQFIAMWGSQLLFDSKREQVNEEINHMISDMPMYQNLSVILNTRRHKGLIHETFPGTIIKLFGTPSTRAQDVVSIRDLVVTYEDRELKLIDQDQRQLYLYNSGDENIHLWAFAPSRVSSPVVRISEHTPRIEINGVIFQRERWELGEANLERLRNAKDAFGIFVEMQRLREQYQLPRYVFFKVDSEKKPFFFDFENFFAIELLHSLLQKNKGVTFIEMEPSPDHLWLKDEEGKYCFEMRGTVFQKGTSVSERLGGERYRDSKVGALS
ncbi:lantibiotic dehydratase [Paenibacillus sp. FSL R7-0272]|uniref:lantibiotic dehydratase n=1 Tax=Paenibacillus sp. FSL R7-0272 TaxID=2921679 RepID=UPI0030DC0B04